MGVGTFSINLIVNNETTSVPDSATSAENMRNSKISEISENSADQLNQFGSAKSAKSVRIIEISAISKILNIHFALEPKSDGWTENERTNVLLLPLACIIADKRCISDNALYRAKHL